LIDSRDGISYETVQIGDHCWMAENLNIGTRIDGSNNQIDNGIIEKYCFNNTEANCDVYGGLYQWDEMMQYETTEGVQGICPDGWHVPTDAEWCELEQEVDATISCNTTGWLGVDGGGKLKEAGTIHWNSPNAGATNSSGFTALPGGYRRPNETFHNVGNFGNWSSSSQHGTSTVWYRSLYYDNAQVGRYYNYKSYGWSVRCLKDETTLPSTFNLNLEVNPADAGAVTGAGQYEAGEQINLTAEANTGWEFVNWSNSDGIVSVAAEFNYTMPEEDVTLTANFVEEQVGFTCGDTFVDARDGQSYETVQIGDQCWIAENLAYLPEVSPSIEGSQTDPRFYVYGYGGIDINEAKASDNYQNYGVLYNWPASIIACPEGWHLPGTTEWSLLINYVVAQGYPNVYTNQNGAGNALKSCRQVNSPLGGDCNTSVHPRWDLQETHHGLGVFGFSSYPGGHGGPNGIFHDLGWHGFWWSSTESSLTEANSRLMRSYNGDVSGWSWDKQAGFSVRCLKD
jgi:uncharacterized protein (TIGR02145 family)